MGKVTSVLMAAPTEEVATTVVFVGHARLPQSLAPRDASPVVTVELEVNVASGQVVAVGTKAIPGLGVRLVQSVLTGRNINDGAAEPADEVRRRYVCPTQKAVCTAIVNAYEAYHRYRQNLTIATF
ncbi:MAG: DUF3870 domain-containing protein [Chloroflexi bacterium]|nr:DUF3870 domain-containing protein [Chloroflexota bacterium]